MNLKTTNELFDEWFYQTGLNMHPSDGMRAAFLYGLQIGQQLATNNPESVNPGSGFGSPETTSAKAPPVMP